MESKDTMESREAQSFQTLEKFVLFNEFCEMGLSRLSLEHLQDTDMLKIWREAQQFLVRQFVLLSYVIFIFVCSFLCPYLF